VENIDLKSERLIYKRVSVEHLTDAYVNWINDPQVNMYLETRGDYTLDLLKDYIEDQYNKEIYFWAIHLKDSKKHIGNIKIDPINSTANSGEYGILMGDKINWGKGYAKEASFTIIDYCIEELKLSKITLGVIEDNINAVLLYKKMGFTIDEVKINVGTYNNKTSNALRMSLHV
jgi:RimJ/RimL family protein N-acetyltransferase